MFLRRTRAYGIFLFVYIYITRYNTRYEYGTRGGDSRYSLSITRVVNQRGLDVRAARGDRRPRVDRGQVGPRELTSDGINCPVIYVRARVRNRNRLGTRTGQQPSLL